ncbi:MAG: DUF2997 domain-containing protein [Clostridia bacterium]|nr:DUF2997 domain-containing protein [Clostridia bacterium]
MSHFTKVATKINDLAALQNALETMGLKLEHHVPCRYYYGTQIRENVAKLPGYNSYDVAFEKNADGTYSIDADFYNGTVEQTIGVSGSTLMRQYAMEKVKMEARKKRYSVHDYGNGKLKIYDPLDRTGAFLEATIDETGNISFKAKGFVGKKCMSFSSLEDAIGVTERKYTDEYHQSERRAEVELLRQKE